MFMRNKKNSFTILAIESSCDETAASVLEVTTSTNEAIEHFQQTKRSNIFNINVHSNIISSQIKLHAKYGGVYPELASREHIKNIIPVLNQALCLNSKNQISKRLNHSTTLTSAAIQQLKDIDYIAVTSGPGLIGSLLVGVNSAETLAYTFNKPLVPINHLEGHIYSNFIRDNNFNKQSNQTISTSKAIEHLPEFPILALIVSGGHTSLVYIKNHLNYKIIGETIDDAAGEAYDKVAAMLELPYPGGPVIDRIASQFQQSQQASKGQFNNFNVLFPRPMLNSKNFDFSFSGLKTSVLYYLKKQKKPYSKKLIKQICYEFQEAVTDVLVTKTFKAAEKYQVKSIVLGGGVAANSRLRNKFSQKLIANNEKLQLFLPEKSFCTDNATAIGVAAAYHIALSNNKFEWYDINANSNLNL